MTEAKVVESLRTFLAALNEEAKQTMRHERVVDNASAYTNKEINSSLDTATSAISAAGVASVACITALAEYDAEKEHREDLESTFDLRWNADQRAIKRWQEANPGNELVWPDHADLVVWLMEQLEKQEPK